MLSRWTKLLILIISLLGLVLPVQAEQRLVVVILTSDISRYQEAYQAFVKTFASEGYDQSNVDIVLQTPNPDPISWANSARKASAIGADLIVTYGTPVTLAAMRESADIPIVFADVYDPVEAGISSSMTGTNRNICGVSSKVPLVTLVKAVMEIKPVRSLGVLYNSREPGSVVQLKEIKRLAAQFGFSVVDANVTSAVNLDAALNHLLSKVDCLYVSESSTACQGFEKIVSRAGVKNIPVISQMPSAAVKGALASLEISTVEQGQVAADYAVKVLNGKKPALMNIGTPKKVELVINLQVARKLGLHVPFQVLSIATRVLK